MNAFSQIHLEKSTKLSFVLLYTIIATFFLLNGESLFQYWSSSWEYATLIYLVAVGLFLNTLDEDVYLKEMITPSLVTFCYTFPAFVIAFIFVRDAGLWFQGSYPVNGLSKLIAHFFFQVCIVAASEEIMFRAVVYRGFLRLGKPVAYVVSAVTFALFHFTAYGGNISSIIIAFALGLVMMFLADYKNLGASIGFHAAYNLFMLGFLII